MKVLINGQLVEYRDEGKGKVVLLLHGWGATLATFDTLAESLRKNYRVVRFDFPGFGGSPKPDDSWDVGAYTALTAQLLEKLKLPPAHALVGHSFGGRVIIKGFAGKQLHAERVVLLGAAGPKPAVTVKKVLFLVTAKVGKALTALPGIKQLRPYLQEKLYGVAGSRDYLDAKGLRPIFQNTIREDLLPLVRAINVPTLMIWGEHDNEVPVDDARRMQKLIKRAKLVVVPDAGHFVHNDTPKEVTTMIKDFL